MVLPRPAHGNARPHVRHPPLRLASAMLGWTLVLVLGWFLVSQPTAVLGATVVNVTPGAGTLAQAQSQAVEGAALQLQNGVYEGRVVVDKPLTIRGVDGAIIRGDGKGSVITIDAPDVVLSGVTITGSGLSLETMDAGVLVTEEGDRALIEDSRLLDNLIGVNLKGADDVVIRSNEIIGRQDLRPNERGNGVHLWNAPGSVVEDNDFRFGRDGIFVNTSKKNVFRGNRFEKLRFAVHYMYTDQSEVSGNMSIGNHIGYALMYSNRLSVHDNVSIDDRDHGIMLNYANYSEITGNVVERGGEKCVFIYNANRNRFEKNRFEGCPIGVHFTGGSERNDFTGNAFIGNETQVKYVGTRWLDWSVDDRGNYWSDHAAFDLDGDGIADSAYRPNDMVDQVLWTHPLAKLLINSPAVQLLRWVQTQFPALYPGGVIDTFPLMVSPDRAAIALAGAS
ncbi:MAG: nitrous oxide reductase family maturation protein NosD [Alphaproteobacteria bacterium]